ncbi:hypothetical protein C0J52_08569 [Blattella germanica]|nr:hypothetical protein C0J52_08569 [Blattella germanica]
MGSVVHNSRNHLDGRIVGGTPAEIANYPYQVAHNNRKSIDSIRIRVGSSIKEQGGSIHAISQVIMHSQYGNYDYDVAVIKVANPFQYSDFLASENTMIRTVLTTALFALCLGAVTRNLRPHFHGRIVGGTPTEISNYPYQISFELNEGHWCGGSILSPDYVLIAAHCVYGKSINSIRIRAGSSYKEQGGSIHAISQVTMHPKYEGGDYDVAVIKVALPFQYSDSVQPITLATKEPEAGTAVVVTGWGDLSSGGSSPSQLQQVQVNIVDHEECSRAYGGGVTELEICAAVPEGGKDSCQGDSGGPLVANGQQVGVVSWGKGCALRGYPGVKSIDSIRIRAGSSYKEQGGSIHAISQVTMHPKYEGGDYDVAVIKVAQPFQYSDSVQPITLATKEPEAGTQVVVTGWGDLSSGGSAPSQLQQVQVNIVDHDECSRAYGGGVTDLEICAAVPEGGKDSCQGDSGGPLVANGQQVGVVSWGKGCALKGYPGVYSAVTRNIRPHFHGRIVGGTPAEITNYPYQISFEWYQEHWCGGSILSPDYVLIAAHCVNGKSINSIRIRAGSSYKEQGGSIHAISQVTMHPKYEGGDYDVAVIKVAQPFQYSDSVQPITLATKEPAAGTQVVVTGWGDLSSGGSAPSQLQQVQVNIVDHEECSRAYGGGVTELEICAAVPEGGKDSCQGDSGGPLVANGQQTVPSITEHNDPHCNNHCTFHPVFGKSIDSIRIRAGSSYKEQGGSIHAISQVTMHPKYEGGDYDVAVIKVAQSFQYSDSVQPITLATKEPEADTQVVVTGWGDLSSGGSAPSQLQQVQVNIVDHDECSRAYTRYGGVSALEICAAVPEGGKDSCQGDSGGPLVANGQQVGVVSWGVGCALKGYPGVYSDVAELRTWILLQAALL